MPDLTANGNVQAHYTGGRKAVWTETGPVLSLVVAKDARYSGESSCIIGWRDA